MKIILGNGLILYCSAAVSTSLLLLLVLAATARSVIYCIAVLQVNVINVSKHTKTKVYNYTVSLYLYDVLAGVGSF